MCNLLIFGLLICRFAPFELNPLISVTCMFIKSIILFQEFAWNARSVKIYVYERNSPVFLINKWLTFP